MWKSDISSECYNTLKIYHFFTFCLMHLLWEGFLFLERDKVWIFFFLAFSEQYLFIGLTPTIPLALVRLPIRDYWRSFSWGKPWSRAFIKRYLHILGKDVRLPKRRGFTVRVEGRGTWNMNVITYRLSPTSSFSEKYGDSHISLLHRVEAGFVLLPWEAFEKITITLTVDVRRFHFCRLMNHQRRTVTVALYFVFRLDVFRKKFARLRGKKPYKGSSPKIGKLGSSNIPLPGKLTINDHVVLCIRYYVLGTWHLSNSSSMENDVLTHRLHCGFFLSISCLGQDTF